MEECEDEIMVFAFGGPLSFGAAADLGHHIRQRTKRGTTAIILDFARVPMVDLSAARAVETIAIDANDAGRLVYTANMSPEVRAKLVGLGIDKHLDPTHAFDTRLGALKAANQKIKTAAKKKPPEQKDSFAGGSPVPAE